MRHCRDCVTPTALRVRPCADGRSKTRFPVEGWATGSEASRSPARCCRLDSSSFCVRELRPAGPEQHGVAEARFKSEPTFWSRLVWRLSFVATRAAMPYGIMALALVLPSVVVLAAMGANVYWVSLVMKMRHVLGAAEAVAAA